MKSSSALAAPASRADSTHDVDAFVEAVMRTHGNVVRNLRRLAEGVAWPVESDARRDREIIDSYQAVYRRPA